MGTKISALTTTGSAPGGAYVPLAYGGENYKIDAANVGGPVAYANLWQTGTQGVVRSENIASITDEGAGETRLTFTNYVTDPVIEATTAVIASTPGGSSYGIGEISLGTAVTTGGDNITANTLLQGDIASIAVVVNRNGASSYDSAQVMVAVW